MKQLSLEEVKAIQLNILQHFDVYCKANGIRYFLCNGSLLGAVKYKGYIPWDDDIDVCLLREDYNRLIQSYSNAEEEYELYCFEQNKEFIYPFAKMADRSTKLIEGCAVDSIFGVNIDIFPIDSFGDDELQIKKICRKIENLRKCLNWARLRNYKSPKLFKSILKCAYSLPYKVVGEKQFCQKIIDEAEKNKTGRFCGNVVWGFYGEGEAFEKELFDEQIMVTFEDGEYPAPKNYDQYLTGLYGQWRKEPPMEKQKTHHSFVAYMKD